MKYGKIDEKVLMELHRKEALSLISFLIGFFEFKEDEFDFTE